MGNNASKDSSHSNRGASRRHDEDGSHTTPQQSSSERIIAIYGPGANSSRRGSRLDSSFLHVNRERHAEPSSTQKPRETRQEKEARRAERERQARLKERERSIREEHVDGGFLVTLGTYIGPEDFSKPVVRQLQIERRLAPFWKGLNDHSDSWTEYQLVAAVRGLPIPAADEIPESLRDSVSHTTDNADGGSENAKQSVPVPATTKAQAETKSTIQLSASHPATSSGLSPLSALGSSPLLRGRAKTLATLASGSRGATPPDLTPQEIQLPHDPNVNGLPVEAYLYREPGECPICFLYYPPYLNKTRCCDQPICSECFVQIKRPDPHLPEHEQPGQPRQPEEHAELLVSEVAACPFCVAPEFGVTYEAPSFRRGLIYANQGLSNLASNVRAATSSQGSFQTGERRRTISISATAPEVVTTDMVRPDWAKRLADARAQALRRSAAATALHNAAYVLGGGGGPESGLRQVYGRRRRSLFLDSAAGSGSQSPREGDDGNSSNDLFPGRTSSRRSRVEDLEDLMMMEAIRLSLAAEEERKRKEAKDKAKDDRKKAKEAKKEAKQLEKLAKKGGGSSTSLYKTQSNDSTSTWASTSMVRSSSNLGSQPMIIEEDTQGKGKAAVHNDTSSSSAHASLTADSQSSDRTASGTAAGDAQRHLEESRANIQHNPSNPMPMPQRGHHFRQLSSTSSLASSLVDSPAGSLQAESPSQSPGFDTYGGSRDGSPFRSGTPSGPSGSLEPMLNFQSLAAMIDNEGKTSQSDHIEDVQDSEKLAKAEEELKGHSGTVSSAGSIVSDSAS